MRSTTGALLALTLLTTGCLSSAPSPAQEAGQATEGPGSWTNETLHLTADMGLTDAEATGEPESVPAGNFYTAWTQGEEQPTWTGTELDQPVVVEQAELTFYYTAESATVTTGPGEEGFPEFVVYVGTEASPAGWASVTGPDVVAEGEIVEVRAELSLPKGGLYLTDEAPPVVKLAPVQGQGSAEDTRLEFLVNGTETPSRVELSGYAAEPSPADTERLLEDESVLAGSAYATGAEEGATARSYTLHVDDATAGLDARLERQTGAGIADIDLQLLGPGEEVVAQSVTPEDDEGLTLRENNVAAIGEGTWTLRVVNYGNAAVQYQLTADMLTASEDAASR